MNKQKKIGERFDWNLCLILFLFFLVSIVAISSAQVSDNDPTNYAFRQVIYYTLGAIIIAVSIYFDPEQFRKLSWFFYGIGVALLVFLLIAPESIAPVTKGAKNWFIIPGIGSLQPSEFMKVFTILTLSRVISDHDEKFSIRSTKSDIWLLSKIGIVSIIPLILIYDQDLGSSLVFISITAGMILVSGINWKIILPIFLTVAAIALTALGLFIFNPDFLKENLGFDQYQIDRVYTWLDPYNNPQGNGYNLIQALTAIGSGEISGKGYNGKEVLVPEQQTDFIFTVIAEEYGFIGASFVISLYFLLVYHLIKVALETKDPFSSYICAGIISMITFHVFENIGMSIQLLPITGIPLPFISSGGSSLIANMFAMGIIFSIRFHHKTYMFSSDNS